MQMVANQEPLGKTESARWRVEVPSVIYCPDSALLRSAFRWTVCPPTQRAGLNVLAYLALLTFTGFITASAQQYVEVSTEIACQFFAPTEANSPAGQMTFRAVCTIGTNTWRLDFERIGNGTTSWHFDGTNVYESLLATAPPITNQALQKLGISPLPFSMARTCLTVNVHPSRDGHPLGKHWANITWLAFCSGNYLRQAGRLIPLPIADVRHSPDAFGFSDVTEAFPDELGLPRVVDLFCSRALLSASVTNEFFVGKRDLNAWLPWIALHPDGVQKFHYEVTAHTNVLGWTLPLSFEFAQREFTRNQPGALLCRGTGEVHSIRVSQAPQNLFVPALRQTINDLRFATTNPVYARGFVYRLTNSEIPSTNDPVLRSQFTTRVKAAVARRERLNKRQSSVPRYIIVLLVVIPIPLFYYLTRQQKGNIP